ISRRSDLLRWVADDRGAVRDLAHHHGPRPNHGPTTDVGHDDGSLSDPGALPDANLRVHWGSHAFGSRRRVVLVTTTEDGAPAGDLDPLADPRRADDGIGANIDVSVDRRPAMHDHGAETDVSPVGAGP